MAVVISAVAPPPRCPRPLHGSSRLSRASGAIPPPPAKSADAELRAPRRALAALDDLEAPLSDDDIESLAPLFCDEEIAAIFAAATRRFSGPRSERAGGKRKAPPPPRPSCCVAAAAGYDGDAESGPPRRPPIKKARTKSGCPSMDRDRDRDDAARRARRMLRGWHRKIAARMLGRRFRPPELSRGRTALRCQCRELAAPGAGDGGGLCALHQDAAPAGRAWMFSPGQQGRVPLVGGPGEVVVPTLSAGDSKMDVVHYAQWRRSVWMPSRFYVQRAAEQGGVHR
ncbi:hypothetical protein U9M48_038642 [Paspalum notatum var. saurae]|uniref:Uncharacterized protein n=1 Tax=Paspalum notatum var. saurae TaxID=547442 RepID=A0AAQ3XDS8_PASNO